MTDQPKQRWITAMVCEATQGLPPLPWERAAKRTRRLRRSADPELTDCA